MIFHLPILSDNYIKRTISIIKMYNFQLINIELDSRSFELLHANDLELNQPTFS